MRCCSLLGLLSAALLVTGCNRGGADPAEDRADSAWDDRGDPTLVNRDDPFRRDVTHEYRREADDVELVSERPERRYDRDSTQRRASRNELAAERAEDEADSAADRFVQDPDGDEVDAAPSRRGSLTSGQRTIDRDDRLEESTARSRRPREPRDETPRSRATLDEAEEDEPRARRPAGDAQRQRSRYRDDE